MVVGACAVSTGGGVKVSRIIIIFKSIRKELKKLTHPNAVSRLKMGGKVVEEDVINGVVIYMVIYVFLVGISFLLVSTENFDLETTFSAILACINNVGPGLGAVGPAGNYSGFSNFSKIVLSIDMLIGRLEILPILLIAAPSFWKQ